MNALSVLSLGLGFVFALLASLCDIRTGRIPNKIVLIAFLTGILIQVWRVLAEIDYPSWRVLTNFAFMVLLCVILYLYDLWAPGDSKMFACTVLFYPMALYAGSGKSIFPALNIVIWAFASGYFIMLIQSFKTKQSLRVQTDSEEKHLWVTVCQMLINFSTVSSAWMTARFLFSQFCNDNLAFCMIIILYGSILFNRLHILLRACVAVVFTALAYVLISESIAWHETVVSFMQALLVSACITALNRSVSTTIYRAVHPSSVRPGMILSNLTVMQMYNCSSADKPLTTTETRRSRLSEAQARAVSDWAYINQCDVFIVETIPFAPFLACGMAIELLRFCFLQ